ncbi:hypothetical protein T439DRAFT_330804 [Meredithblackwellia eburnea MCA 4105]
MPNHLSNTLAPLLFITTFLLALFTILAPTNLFSDRVALLELNGNGTALAASAANSTRLRARALGREGVRVLPLAPPKMYKIKKAKRKVASTLVTTSSSPSNASSTSSASLESVVIRFGPLGACYQIGKSSDLTCQSPSFTPIFTPVYEHITSVPSTLLETLPDQFPLAPTALFLGTVLTSIALLTSVLASLPFHLKKLAVFEKRRVSFSRISLYSGAVGAGMGLITTITWRLQLGSAVDKFQTAAKVAKVSYHVSLGSAFNQLWAAWSLGAVAVVLTALSSW